MNRILTPLSTEAKQVLRRKLKMSWAAYWVLLFAMIFVAGEVGGTAATVALLAWFGSAAWLATLVAEAASSNGGSAFVWGCGVIFLGPLGALILPITQLLNLNK